MERRCPRCGVSKPLDAFTVSPTGRVAGYCRPCVAEAKRVRYAERPEVRARAIEQAKLYRAQHREELAAKQREWERQNEERRKAQRQARRMSG